MNKSMVVNIALKQYKTNVKASLITLHEESGAIRDQTPVLICWRTAVLWNWRAIVPSTNKDLVWSR